MRGWATAIALLVAACHADRIATEDEPVSFDADAWSGGTLVVRSAAFRGRDSLPIVMAGADTLGVTPLGADSVLVRLPDTNGTITVSVRLTSGGDPATGPVRIHGFAGASVGPSVDGPLLPWPGGGAPIALAFYGGRLVRLDLRFGDGALSPVIPDTGLSSICGHGPMPSAADPALVVISHSGPSGSCGPLIAVPLSAGGPPPDTGPPPYYQFPAVHLARGRWLIDYKQHLRIVTGSPAAGFVAGPDILCGQPWGFAVSPRGDRVAPRGCYVPSPGPGLPVFDIAGPGVAYYLSSMDQSDEAAFSDGGDTLFRSGSRQIPPDWSWETVLEAVDATSGRVLASTRLGAASWALTVDPGRPWIYVYGWSGAEPVVELFDRGSLAHVATLRVPAAAVDSSLLYYNDYVAVLSPVERRLYVTLRRSYPQGPIRVLKFDLMP